ncbi:MAG: hypothetical protein AB8G05_26210 [Oligoflexales bacterium]
MGCIIANKSEALMEPSKKIPSKGKIMDSSTTAENSVFINKREKTRSNNVTVRSKQTKIVNMLAEKFGLKKSATLDGLIAVGGTIANHYSEGDEVIIKKADGRQLVVPVDILLAQFQN